MTAQTTDLQRKLAGLWPHLNERTRRMVAASEARQMGYGGVSEVSWICGLSRVTILKGMRELECEALPAGRVRRAGAGPAFAARAIRTAPRWSAGG